jgi:hypothetical protein
LPFGTQNTWITCKRRGFEAARTLSASCWAALTGFKRGPVAHEYDLAYHASPPEQLLRASCLGKRKSLRDERLDLLLLKEVKQGD